jgi:hypothetical protein
VLACVVHVSRPRCVHDVGYLGPSLGSSTSYSAVGNEPEIEKQLCRRRKRMAFSLSAELGTVSIAFLWGGDIGKRFARILRYAK